jgi:hypothetical protein
VPPRRPPAVPATIRRLICHATGGNLLNRPARAFVLAVCLLTAACGGSATAAPQAARPSLSASPPAAAPASPATAPGTSAAGAANGAALCAFLTSEVPALQKAGSTGGAVAQLAIDYANWIAADASRVLPDAAAMDTLTEAACPEIRTTVLKLLGGDNFANSL